MTGCVTLVTRRQVPLVDQELLTILKNMDLEDRIAQSLVVYVVFIGYHCSPPPFFLDHCIVCPSIDFFSFPLWYLQLFSYRYFL